MANPLSVEKYRADVAAYASEQPLYQTLARVLERVLKRAAEDLGLEAIVQVRAKELASFAEKTIRKQARYPDPLNMMTDLCGARVITESTNEIPLVCDFIRKHFEIDEANSEDAAARLGVSEFGYRSVHFIVSLKREEFHEDIDAVVAGDPDARSTADRLFARRSAEDCVGKPFGPGPRYKAEIQVRSLLQHAWASLYHDRVYKNDFAVPEHLRRELSRIAATLEESDEDFSRAIETVDGYHQYYGAYLPRERLGEELGKQQRVRELDPENLKLALRAARLAVCLERWEDVDEALAGFVRSWEGAAVRQGDSETTRGQALDQLLANLAAAQTSSERRRARDALGIWQDGRAANLLLDYGTAQWRLGRKALARTCLNRAIGLDLGSADALIVFADTYDEDRDFDEARRCYALAFEVSPGEPRALRGFLQLTAEEGRNLDFVEPMRPTLRDVVERCRERARLGIYLPWAYYDIGFFSLLLGESYKGLEAYALAVELSHSERPIEGALQRARRLDDALHRTVHEEWSWLERFLLIARYVKLEQLARDTARLVAEQETALSEVERALSAEVSKATGTQSADKVQALNGKADMARADLERLSSEATRLREKAAEAYEQLIGRASSKACPELAGKVVIVAGGCADEEERRMTEYEPLLRGAFSDYAGAIFSGGTRSGISRLVGDLPDSSRGPILKVACLPESLPSIHDKHPAYTWYLHKGQGFSPRGAIQVWADILSAGIEPSAVRVLGINGGRYAGLEYRLALVMGAKVGVLRGSGRAADAIMEDLDWKDHPNLIELPYDPQTVKIFVAGFSSAGVLTDVEREEAASRQHERNVEQRRRQSFRDDRPENQPWERLRADLKDSIRERVDFIVEQLGAFGMRVVRQDALSPETPVVQDFDPGQVETMAEMEHGRWSVHKLVNGWRWGANKDDKLRTHPDLIPWSLLSEEDRDKDRNFARQIPGVLREQRYAIVRSEQLAQKDPGPLCDS